MARKIRKTAEITRITKVTYLPALPDEPICTYVSADNRADAEKYRLLQAQRLIDDILRDEADRSRRGANDPPGKLIGRSRRS